MVWFFGSPSSISLFTLKVLRYINTPFTCKQDPDARKLITFNYELTSCLWAIFYQWLWPKIKRLAVKRFIRSQNRHRRWLWYCCFWMGCCFTCFFFFLMLCLGKWVVCFGLLLTIGGKVLKKAFWQHYYEFHILNNWNISHHKYISYTCIWNITIFRIG